MLKKKQNAKKCDGKGCQGDHHGTEGLKAYNQPMPLREMLTKMLAEVPQPPRTHGQLNIRSGALRNSEGKIQGFVEIVLDGQKSCMNIKSAEIIQKALVQAIKVAKTAPAKRKKFEAEQERKFQKALKASKKGGVMSMIALMDSMKNRPVTPGRGLDALIPGGKKPVEK